VWGCESAWTAAMHALKGQGGDEGGDTPKLVYKEEALSKYECAGQVLAPVADVD